MEKGREKIVDIEIGGVTYPRDSKYDMNYEDINNLTIDCVVCGEKIKLSENDLRRIACGSPIAPKICDKCRNAILWARENMG